jgi:hypothetical protein
MRQGTRRVPELFEASGFLLSQELEQVAKPIVGSGLQLSQLVDVSGNIPAVFSRPASFNVRADQANPSLVQGWSVRPYDLT